MTLPTTDDLQRLLEYLPVRPKYAGSLDSLREIGFQDPSKPLPISLIEKVTTYRRIVLASKDYQQVGLFEFHLGLFYLEGGRYDGAAEQFEYAKRQWLFCDEKAMTCLAEFARGVALHYALEYSEAVDSYLWARECISEAEPSIEAAGRPRKREQLQAFRSDLGKQLQSAIEALQENEVVIEPPLIKDELTGVRRGRNVEQKLTLVFELEIPLSPDFLQQVVLPLIEGIDRVNNTLRLLIGWESSSDKRGSLAVDSDITIERITYLADLEIVLNGLIFQTVELFQHLLRDSAFREEYERLIAARELASARLEMTRRQSRFINEVDLVQLKKSRLEAEFRRGQAMLGDLLYREAREIVDSVASLARTSEQSHAMSVAIMPGLQSIADSLAGTVVLASASEGVQEMGAERANHG